MKVSADKLRLIYKHFVLITISFILVYTFLHWLLFIKGKILLNEEMIKIFLPFFTSCIPILIYLRPRIHLLRFKNDKIPSLLQLFASIAIATPTVIAQEYLATATGKLPNLKKSLKSRKQKRQNIMH